MHKSSSIPAVIFILILCVLGGLVYLVAANSSRLGWRIQALEARLAYWLDRPEEKVFVPQASPTTAVTATPLPTLTPTPTIQLATPLPTATATAEASPTPMPTPLPAQAQLGGIVHMFQMWNNCGPANLAMALTYWGWKGDQRHTAAFLKLNDRDKNVMPYEMEMFVEEQTGLLAVVRMGGDAQMLKTFLSAGFPVIVEKGFEGEGFDGWMGHYQVVNGYDDARQVFIVQDSYKGADLPIGYEPFLNDWRAFNYTYLVIYPPDRQQQVLDILGLQAYDNFNNHTAAQKAQAETAVLSGRDLFFALFNRGVSLTALRDYSSAATAFDAAFANYALLPTASRPWRMMWYQTAPYFAYYYTGRYQDVINLATTTLEAMNEPVLEESYYWRALAQLALGQNEAAVKDLRKCLEVHQGFSSCVIELQKLGLNP